MKARKRTRAAVTTFCLLLLTFTSAALMGCDTREDSLTPPALRNLPDLFSRGLLSMEVEEDVDVDLDLDSGLPLE